MRKSLRMAVVTGAIAAAFAGGIGVAVAGYDGPATYGTIPDEAFGPDGSINLERVPDYVLAHDRNGEPAGYVSKAELFDPYSSGEQTVVDEAGSLVGHMKPGYGFVPLGADPSAMILVEATAGPAPGR